MNLNQLKYFLAIVKTGSFSNAADDMYISQSSMSKQIKALETELGIDLFKREHSKVYLTDIGAEFAKYAESTVKQHNDMLLYLDEFATKKSNTIRCGQCMKDCHRKHDIGFQQFHIIYSAFGK